MIVSLMHCNHKIATMEINESSGAITRLICTDKERMPYLKEMDLKEINHWWTYRAIPEKRFMMNVAKEVDIDNPLMFQTKNLALSLSDSYWVCPTSMNLNWNEINLYENTKHAVFVSKEDKEFTNDPNSTLNGSRPKKAFFQNGKWDLIKYRETTYGEQCINEAFATGIHEQQGFTHFTQYTLQTKGERPFSCTCRFFTGKNIEFVPAWNFVANKKTMNDRSPYESYIEQCVSYGLREEEVRRIMDYQTLTDFVITNSDRHYNNFGILRDPESLEVLSLAPLFDFGNSMFFRDCFSMSAYDILNLEITAMAKKEEKMLEYVKDKTVVDIERLPNQQDAADYYAQYGLPEEMVMAISGNYQKKIEMLYMFRKGCKVSRYAVKDWKHFLDQ